MMHRQDAPDNHDAAEERTAAAVRDLAGTVGEGLLEIDTVLSEVTTFRIGGPAAGLAHVRTSDDARRFLEFAGEREIDVLGLGGGSNLLVDDNGFCGLILRMEMSDVVFGPGTVRAGAGLPFDDLIALSLAKGRPGLEFASGIPGSLGGAVVGNAGCYGHEIGEFVLEATLLRPDGSVERVGPEDLGFRYRSSDLKGSDTLLLDVLIHAEAGNVTAAVAERHEHLTDRLRKHPVDEPCAGSYFQNLTPSSPGERRRAAGALLDELGVRGWREGDAAVYHKHANIIVNLGRATCLDVLTLAGRMKAAVVDKFGEELVEEVRHLPRHRTGRGFCG